MALHRDIFWIGRQWAVTGFGIQAVDQRLRGVLDIEIDKLWDDDFVMGRRGKPGINLDDFDKALAVARTRHPRPEVDPAPGRSERSGISDGADAGSLVAMLSKLQPPPLAAMPPKAVKPPPPAPALRLRTEGRLARFVPQWRVRR